MRQLRGQVLEKAELMLAGPEVNYLGPDLALRDCNVILKVTARELTITRTMLSGCVITAKKKLTNFRWCNASIERCSFLGTYSGCDFGNWPEFYEAEGHIVGSDFSNAILDGCRFLNTDIAQMKLPGWPCFTVLHPQEHASEFQSLGAPFEILGRTYLDFPSAATAVTHHAPSLIKRLGGQLELLASTLSKMDYVKR